MTFTRNKKVKKQWFEVICEINLVERMKVVKRLVEVLQMQPMKDKGRVFNM